MIQLIADSGSTKTDWRLTNKKETVAAFQTPGLNPYHQNDITIKNIIDSSVISNLDSLVPEKIFFYGAGCAAPENCMILSSCLTHYFPGSEISIQTDLLGAARAILKSFHGFVAILGTGSNSGLYDGSKITKTVDSLGWIIGDEGSGSSMGKMILKKFLRKEFPSSLEAGFSEFCRMNRDQIIQQLYAAGSGKAFAAGMMHFARANLDDLFIYQILLESFEEFVREVVCRYELAEGTALNFAGNVAFHFQKPLGEVLIKHRYAAGMVVQSPVDELVKFHLGEW